ncbi:MAG: pyridoxamine 5'-phosphate oxidase family protein [Bryobacteraceae bacterium]
MNRDELLAFMRKERYAVQASVSANGAPQASIVGIVVSDQFEVFFDTLSASRKSANLLRNPGAALVIGPADANADRTVQLEGIADEPSGSDLERLLELYFARFPDGKDRQSWPGIIYLRVRPTWIRYSSFAVNPPEILEFGVEDLK